MIKAVSPSSWPWPILHYGAVNIPGDVLASEQGLILDEFILSEQGLTLTRPDETDVVRVTPFMAYVPGFVPQFLDGSEMADSWPFHYEFILGKQSGEKEDFVMDGINNWDFVGFLQSNIDGNPVASTYFSTGLCVETDTIFEKFCAVPSETGSGMGSVPRPIEVAEEAIPIGVLEPIEVLEVVEDDTVINPNGNFCGKSWDEMIENCDMAVACPGGDECGPGEACFAGSPCALSSSGGVTTTPATPVISFTTTPEDVGNGLDDLFADFWDMQPISSCSAGTAGAIPTMGCKGYAQCNAAGEQVGDAIMCPSGTLFDGQLEACNFEDEVECSEQDLFNEFASIFDSFEEFEGILEESDELFLTDLEKYNPIWYDRSSGWAGQTYLEAIQFCSSIDEGMVICPYEAICPLGPGSEPVGGNLVSEEAWAPVADNPNDWAQVGSTNSCALYSTLPIYELETENTPGVMCCDEDVPMVTTTPAMITNNSGDVYASIAEKYKPLWFDRSSGWSGQTYLEALQFCEAAEGMVICPYEAICPLGPGSEPLGGYQDDLGVGWAPIIDSANEWVYVSSVEGCALYSTLYLTSPEWGITGKDNEDITRSVMCCENVEVVEVASQPCPDVLDRSTIIDTEATLHYAVVPSNPTESGNGLFCARLEVKTDGWVALAISADGRMIGSEAIIALPSDGTVLKYDLGAMSVNRVIPMAEEKQTLIDPSIIQEDGKTILEFSKLLVEEGEIPILEEGENAFLHARGSGSSLGYHGPSRSSFAVDFSAGSTNLICEIPTAGCTNGMFNQLKCECECIVPFCPDVNGDCTNPSNNCGGNPWEQCTRGVDCPWWVNPFKVESCTTGPSVPSGLWQIYNTNEACCNTNFPYSIVCNAGLEGQQLPTRHPTISFPLDDSYEVIPFKFDVLGLPDDVPVRDIKDEILTVLKQILLRVADRISDLRISNVEEKVVMSRSLMKNRRSLEKDATFYFNAYVIRDEGKKFGPLIINEIRDSYDEVLEQIETFSDIQYFNSGIEWNLCTTQNGQYNLCVRESFNNNPTAPVGRPTTSLGPGTEPTPLFPTDPIFPTVSPAPTANRNFCGFNKEDAENRCANTIPCPNGLNSTCLIRQACFQITGPCDAIDDADSAGSISGNAAYTPTVNQSPAPIWKTTSPTESPTKPHVFDQNATAFCGTDYLDVLNNCYKNKACTGAGGNDECPSGQICFPEIFSCNTPPPTMSVAPSDRLVTDGPTASPTMTPPTNSPTDSPTDYIDFGTFNGSRCALRLSGVFLHGLVMGGIVLVAVMFQ